MVSSTAVRPIRISLPIEDDPSTMAGSDITFNAARNDPSPPGLIHHATGLVTAPSGWERKSSVGGVNTSVVTSQLAQSKPNNTFPELTNTLARMIPSQKFGIARQTIPPKEAK